LEDEDIRQALLYAVISLLVAPPTDVSHRRGVGADRERSLTHRRGRHKQSSVTIADPQIGG
jgi:hypothetical protein